MAFSFMEISCSFSVSNSILMKLGKLTCGRDVLIYQMVVECNKFQCNLQRAGLDVEVDIWRGKGSFLGGK